jgi:hypothetical protein
MAKFTEILDRLEIEYITEGNHARPGWVNIDCPWCGKHSRKFHLGYCLDAHYLSCWRCGPHNPIETLMEHTGYSYHACKKLLKDMTLPRLVEREKPKGKLILPKGLKSLGKSHRKYLRNRGFNSRRIEKMWNVKGIGLASELSWRIFIPIIYHGKTVSWTTRSISASGKVMRYVSASLEQESLPHKSLLYGADYVRDTAIIQEGPLDVWAIGPGSVATLGTSYSVEQFRRMTEIENRVICFDSDATAQIRARKLCDDLSCFPGKTTNLVIDAKDAAEASKKEIKLIRKTFLD